jgi:hypothetical protein
MSRPVAVVAAVYLLSRVTVVASFSAEAGDVCAAEDQGAAACDSRVQERANCLGASSFLRASCLSRSVGLDESESRVPLQPHGGVYQVSAYVARSMAIGRARSRQPVRSPLYRGAYFTNTSARARSASSPDWTTRARAGRLSPVNSTKTTGSVHRFCTQSDDRPPPDSRYSLSPSDAYQISMRCGRPLRRPVVVR